MDTRLIRLMAVCTLLILLLTGCGADPAPPVQTDPTAAVTTPNVTEPAKTEPPVSVETVAATEPIEETTAPAQTEAPKTELPYLQRIPYADQSIFDGPGYDYGFVGTVKESGTYTIVEEARDVEDNLWGKLKSGAGWVDLTDIRSEERKNEPLRANYADDQLLKSGNFHRYVGCTAEYALQIAFRANESLTEVRLYSMEFNETMELSEELFQLSRLEPEKPFVADLDFPGDFSTYAILFTDNAGQQRYFTITISLRNGAVELIEQP